jgi:hypothetical protein
MILAPLFEDQASLYQCRMEAPFHLQSASLLFPVSLKTKLYTDQTNKIARSEK